MPRESRLREGGGGTASRHRLCKGGRNSLPLGVILQPASFSALRPCGSASSAAPSDSIAEDDSHTLMVYVIGEGGEGEGRTSIIKVVIRDVQVSESTFGVALERHTELHEVVPERKRKGGRKEGGGKERKRRKKEEQEVGGNYN